MKKKSDFRLGKLFQNNKFLLALSLVFSVIIWISMSLLGTDNNTTMTISNIPVNTVLPESASAAGLRIFSGDNQTASVVVSGNRITLGSLTTDDIQVSAQTSSITTSGPYNLPLTAQKSSLHSDFQLASASVSPSTITVYVDYYREKTLDIQDNIVYQVAPGYYALTTLSAQQVKISGPQTEVSKVASAVVSKKMTDTLTDSTSLTEAVKLYDSDGYEITNNLLTLSVENVTADITVLPEKTISLKPTFKGKPSGLSLSSNIMTLDPSSIRIAGPEDTLSALDSLDLEAVDFSRLSNQKETISVSVPLPDNCRNLSNQTTVSLTLDFSSMKSKKFTVTNFSVSGSSSQYRADVTTKALEVTLIGPESQLESLTDEDLSAAVDISSADGTTGSTSMPVVIHISGADSCWAYGTYKADVTIDRVE